MNKQLIDLLLEYKNDVTESKLPRLTWDTLFIGQALLNSFRSPSQKLQVGSVIVKENRIISTGYNGFPRGCDHIPIVDNGHEINTIHAEVNAIVYVANSTQTTRDSTIYITHYPCINCAKTIIAAGIVAVKYLFDYNNDKNVKTMLDGVHISVEQLKY